MELYHENEKDIFGENAENCLALHEAFPRLRAVFDPANFVQCGQDTMAGWQLLKEHIHYLHIKDALEDGSGLPDYVNFPAQRFTNTYALCFGDSNTLEAEPAGYGNWFRVFSQWVGFKGYKSYGVSDACIQNDIAGKPVISTRSSIVRSSTVYTVRAR